MQMIDAKRQQPVVVERRRFLADRRDLHLDALAAVGLADARRRDHVADAAINDRRLGGVGLGRRPGRFRRQEPRQQRLERPSLRAPGAAAGVSPAAAKAIAHPNNLIISPDVPGTGNAAAPPDLAVSISAAFRTLKRFIPATVEAPSGAA